MTGGSSTLRNRKKKDDEAPSLAEEPVSSEMETTSVEAPSSFRLIPLIELPLLARLDVLPFIVLYGFLVGVDVYLESDEDDFGRFLLSFIFGGILLGHVGLVLACQWDKSFQTLVGYQMASSDSTKASTPGTLASGRRKSVSRVPGAPPITCTPATIGASPKTTLTPDFRTGSVACPTDSPATSVIWFRGPGLKRSGPTTRHSGPKAAARCLRGERQEKPSAAKGRAR